MNNISIDGSTIGVLNTGTVQSIDSAVTAISSGGNKAVALAIRDPAVAEMYIHPDSANELDFVEAIEESLPEAENYLDRIAQEARREAETFAPNAAPLILLVDYTRELSRQ